MRQVAWRVLGMALAAMACDSEPRTPDSDVERPAVEEGSDRGRAEVVPATVRVETA